MKKASKSAITITSNCKKVISNSIFVLFALSGQKKNRFMVFREVVHFFLLLLQVNCVFYTTKYVIKKKTRFELKTSYARARHTIISSCTINFANIDTRTL